MGALQFPDRRQHFLMGGKDGRPEACILQRLGAAHRIAEGGGGLVQAVHAEVLGHALEGVAGAESQLPILRVQCRIGSCSKLGSPGYFRTNFLMSASLGRRLRVAL